MGNKNTGASEKAEISGSEKKRREIVNTIVLLIMFIGYTLTFMIPKFYGATDAYVGVFVFLMLVILTFNNMKVFTALKNKDIELYVLAALVVITGINLLLVNSGKGAFFVAVDFMLIWYLSDKLILTKNQLLLFTGLYMAMLLYWLFIAYPKLFADYQFYGYNTNTAATFTIYTLLCAFMLLEQLYDKSPIVGLFMVMLLLKGFQLALWHRARGAFIMLILFIVFRFIIPKKWWNIKPLYVVLCVLATIGSLLFVMMYVVVGATGVNFKMPFFYKDVFSGRDKIWYEFFTLFCKKPLTGIGTNVTIESFFEFNVHNAMYNFLVIHGVIVLVGILYFIYKRLQANRRMAVNSRIAMSAMCAIMAVFFESYFDVDLIWADYALNLMLLLCVVNACGDNGNE